MNTFSLFLICFISDRHDNISISNTGVTEKRDYKQFLQKCKNWVNRQSWCKVTSTYRVNIHSFFLSKGIHLLLPYTHPGTTMVPENTASSPASCLHTGFHWAFFPPYVETFKSQPRHCFRFLRVPSEHFYPPLLPTSTPPPPSLQGPHSSLGTAIQAFSLVL